MAGLKLRRNMDPVDRFGCAVQLFACAVVFYFISVLFQLLRALGVL
jgi:hypothetical protein